MRLWLGSKGRPFCFISTLLGARALPFAYLDAKRASPPPGPLDAARRIAETPAHEPQAGLFHRRRGGARRNSGSRGFFVLHGKLARRGRARRNLGAHA